MPGRDDITFVSLPAPQVSRATYRFAQALERLCFTESLNRSQDEIDYLIDWDNPVEFANSRINPMQAVYSGKLRPDQSFSKPIATFAYEDEKMVGYAYSANNVSGNITQQAIKRMRGNKNYVWFREIAVHPDYRRQGIARTLGYLSLQERKTKQPVTAYVWEEADVKKRLESLGFVSTGISKPYVFGEAAPPVVQHRMQASGHVLVQRLASIGTLLSRKRESKSDRNA
jgi:GNAT superfamily N-acetyltransferase